MHPIINVFVSVLIIALQLFLLSYTVLFSSTIILVKLEYPPNAEFPIFVTLSGIVKFVNSLQLTNAPFPIFITLFPIDA